MSTRWMFHAQWFSGNLEKFCLRVFCYIMTIQSGCLTSCLSGIARTRPLAKRWCILCHLERDTLVKHCKNSIRGGCTGAQGWPPWISLSMSVSSLKSLSRTSEIRRGHRLKLITLRCWRQKTTHGSVSTHGCYRCYSSGKPQCLLWRRISTRRPLLTRIVTRTRRRETTVRMASSADIVVAKIGQAGIIQAELLQVENDGSQMVWTTRLS